MSNSDKLIILKQLLADRIIQNEEAISSLKVAGFTEKEIVTLRMKIKSYESVINLIDTIK